VFAPASSIDHEQPEARAVGLVSLNPYLEA